jgi:hypothetical protein
MRNGDLDTVFSLLVLALFALGVALMVGGFRMTGAFLATFFGAFSYIVWFRGPR